VDESIEEVEMGGRRVNKSSLTVLLAAALMPFVGPATADPPAKPKVSEGKADADGILVHAVEGDYQDRPTTVRVLLPGKPEEGRRYPVLYVLPVEAGDGTRYGDGLLEVKKLGLHDKYGLVCVQPTFARLPWYANHPTDKGVRQESYLLEVVLPLVEERYPVVAKPEGRLLLGFSKSGWGAFSLLLRHPDTFGRAAAWDAPLDLDRPGKYGSGDVFGDDETFQKYRITRLLEERAGKLGDGNRLAVLGYGNFRESHRAVHDLMDKLKVAHEYRDGPERKHDWHSGWVAEAVEFLAADGGK
jgi:S-formylglutathione hydrolase FrmB